MCYARAYPWSEEQRLAIHSNVAEKVERELDEAAVVFPLYISQITDCLQPVAEVRALTLGLVRLGMRLGVSFRLVSRSGDGLRWLLSEAPELADYPRWAVSVTVDAPPGKDLVLSPGASPVEERLAAMKELVAVGVSVTGRTDPFIVGFVTREEQLWLLREIAATGAKHVVSSAGAYNDLSMGRLLCAIETSKFAGRAELVMSAYGVSETARGEGRGANQYRLRLQDRIELHRWMRREVEALGMTYGVCLEMPKEYDSPGIPHCEGSDSLKVCVREAGALRPIECWGDCLRSCPDPEEPPCGHPEFGEEYPYRKLPRQPEGQRLALR